MDGKVMFHLGEGDHVEIRSVASWETLEVIQAERLNHLTGSIWPEVEHQNTVSVVDDAVLKPHRFKEFIGDVLGITVSQHLFCRPAVDGDVGIGVEVVRLFDSLPTLVPVHGPVPATEAGELADAGSAQGCFHLVDVSRCALGGCVATIGDGMYGEIGDAAVGCPLDQPTKMLNMACLLYTSDAADE